MMQYCKCTVECTIKIIFSFLLPSFWMVTPILQHFLKNETVAQAAVLFGWSKYVKSTLPEMQNPLLHWNSVLRQAARMGRCFSSFRFLSPCLLYLSKSFLPLASFPAADITIATASSQAVGTRVFFNIISLRKRNRNVTFTSLQFSSVTTRSKNKNIIKTTHIIINYIRWVLTLKWWDAYIFRIF